MPRNPGQPHYRRIANAVLASIQGKGSRGRRVPSETEVARKFRVAKNTARRALDELVKLGCITRMRGSGSFSTGPAVKTIYAVGYRIQDPDFVRLFKWLEHRLGAGGYRLVVGDMGLDGRQIHQAFRPDEARRADAAIWMVPSHPHGIRAAAAARRKLPKRMPILCIADPLGLSLQSRHRIDLVHWDYPTAIHRILALCDREGFTRPVLVSRSDVKLFSTNEAERAFMAELTARGVKRAADRVVPWDVFDPQAGEKFVRHVRSRDLRPDSYVLQYGWMEEFQRQCAAAGLTARTASMWVFDSADGRRGMKMDFRAMAEVCSDLLLNRLQKPNRPNLRVALNIPIRRSTWPTSDGPDTPA